MSYGYIPNCEFFFNMKQKFVSLCLQIILCKDFQYCLETSRLYRKYNPLNIRYDTIAIGWHTYNFDFSLYELNNILSDSEIKFHFTFAYSL